MAWVAPYGTRFNDLVQVTSGAFWLESEEMEVVLPSHKRVQQVWGL